MQLSEDGLRHARQEKMSMVFQKFALLPHKTVLKNAGMPLSVRGEDEDTCDREAAKWLDRVGLSGFENYYPAQLSGGMQQRVGIARALSANTPIMLMDEAFSALDPLIRTDMQDLLLELQKELHKTIIFITHDLDEALKLADHLVILKDGFIVQQGEPQHILLNPNDPYIEDFVSDINRARVLRVRSIMTPLGRWHSAKRCPWRSGRERHARKHDRAFRWRYDTRLCRQGWGKDSRHAGYDRTGSRSCPSRRIRGRCASVLTRADGRAGIQQIRPGRTAWLGRPRSVQTASPTNVSSFGLGARSFCVAKYQRPGSGTEMSNGLTKRPLSRSRVQNGARAMAIPRFFKTASRTSG